MLPLVSFRVLFAIVALGTLLCPLAGSQAPEHVHLALTEASGQVVVTWRSPTPLPADVSWGATPAHGSTAPGTLSPEAGAQGFVGTAVLDGLLPDGVYHYRVGSADVVTGDFAFRAPPSPNGTLRFTVWGDHGTSADAQRTVQGAVAWAPHLHLHTGDLSYANGVPAVWDRWFAMIEPLAASAAYMPALGNHEIEPTGAASQGGQTVPPAAYLARFALPHNERWYAFEAGSVRFVALDTESSLGSGSDQREWLAEELAAPTEVAWRVVYFHRSAFSSNAAHGSFQPARDLQAEFERAGVDLVLAGHDHSYERTWPLRGGEPAVASGVAFAPDAGVIHVTTGGGGEGLYDEFESPQPTWSAVRLAQFHRLQIEASPSRLSVHAVGLDGGTLDAFAIEAPTQADDEIAPPDPPARPTPGFEIAATLAALALLLARRR